MTTKKKFEWSNSSDSDEEIYDPESAFDDEPPVVKKNREDSGHSRPRKESELTEELVKRP